MSRHGASIGAMRHKVIIQQVTSTTDAGGGRSVAWSNYKTVFAHVEQLSAQVKFDQGVVDERGLYRFTMRFLTGVDTRNRLSFDNKIFNIDSVINLDERKKYLVIRAKEGVAV